MQSGSFGQRIMIVPIPMIALAQLKTQVGHRKIKAEDLTHLRASEIGQRQKKKTEERFANGLRWIIAAPFMVHIGEQKTPLICCFKGHDSQMPRAKFAEYNIKIGKQSFVSLGIPCGATYAGVIKGNVPVSQQDDTVIIREIMMARRRSVDKCFDITA